MRILLSGIFLVLAFSAFASFFNEFGIERSQTQADTRSIIVTLRLNRGVVRFTRSTCEGLANAQDAGTSWNTWNAMPIRNGATNILGFGWTHLRRPGVNNLDVLDTFIPVWPALVILGILVARDVRLRGRSSVPPA
jgi:hypothetical protein